MLYEKKCELNSNHVIEPDRAKYPRTKYCLPCSRLKKNEDTKESCRYEGRKEYLAEAQRRFVRRHPGNSTPRVRRLRSKQKSLLATMEPS
jgi:hypothetical protein